MENLEPYRMWLVSECGRTEGYAKQCVEYLRRFEKWLDGRHTLAAVPLAEVREYIRDKSRAGNKPRSIHKIVNCIRSYLKNPYVDRGPDARNIDRPKADHLKYLLPNADEVKRHLEAATSLRNRAVLALLYSSGLREAELCKLRVEDIEDWFEGRIRVNRGKGGKDRIVFADTAALVHVRAWLDSRPQPLLMSDWVFPAVKRPGAALCLRQINEIVHRTAVCAGIQKRSATEPGIRKWRVTPHTCRRYCATHLLRENHRKHRFDALALVSQFLGHASFEATMPYIVLDDDERKKLHAERHPRERMARGESPWISLT